LVNAQVAWAAQAVREQPPRTQHDSVTIVTDFDERGEVSRIELQGWHQLLNSDGMGTFAFSNTISRRGLVWGMIPQVRLVRLEALLDTPPEHTKGG
jgi:hypothetical protein